MTQLSLEPTLPQRLLVCGWIDRIASEVARGMPVLAQNGSPVGVAAAVVQSGPTQAISHILLGQAPPTAVYRLIPIDLLDRLDGEQIWLRAAPAQVTALPIYQAEV